VFAEHFHHAAVWSDIRAVGVLWLDLGKPRFQRGFVDVLQPIRRVLVGAEYPEAAHVVPHHVAQKFSQRFGRRDFFCAGTFDFNCIVAKIGKSKRLAQLPAVGVRVRGHAAVAFWRKFPKLRKQRAMFIE